METAFSVAFDLGTTTLAAVLLKGKQILARTFRTNPQRAFGADVISRISTQAVHRTTRAFFSRFF